MTMTDNAISQWDKGKAAAFKRFGRTKSKPTPKPDTTTADAPTDWQPPTPTGAAAGVAEAAKRFGTRSQSKGKQ